MYTLQSQYLYVRNHNLWTSPACAKIIDINLKYNR